MYKGPRSIIPAGNVYDSATRDRFRAGKKAFYDDPEAFSIEPFKIWENLYYVGDKLLCMHLVDTGEGLLLIDCGYGHTTHMIERSIEQLGFDCHDLKWIIVTHGHFDHFGSGNVLREKYGCKIYMSRVDTDLIRENPERALMSYGPHPMEMCWPDETIEDGQVLTFGNLQVRCVLAPGHTYGVMALFFEVGGKMAGTWGGTGMTSLHGQWCRDLGLPAKKADAMLDSVKKLRGEKVEINLGNHPPQNCTLEKRQWMLEHPGENPFLGEEDWQIMLDQVEEQIMDLIRKGYDK